MLFRSLVINSFSKYFCMTGWRVGWMLVPEPLVRPVERLQGNLAISVPTLSQIAAEAAFDGRAEMEAVKHGYQENRRILIEGLPKAGLDKFLPVDGAFYLYADVSRFSNDSFDFAKRMLEQAHVAATPGIDFDPIHGKNFIRFCYAGSATEMREAVERIGGWLSRRLFWRASTQRRGDVAAVHGGDIGGGFQRQRLGEKRLRHVGGRHLAAEQVAAHVILFAHSPRLGALGDEVVGQQPGADAVGVDRIGADAVAAVVE